MNNASIEHMYGKLITGYNNVIHTTSDSFNRLIITSDNAITSNIVPVTLLLLTSPPYANAHINATIKYSVKTSIVL